MWKHFSAKRTAIALALLAFMAMGQDVWAADDQASIVRGGRLYANWFEELKESAPAVVHRAYPAAGRYGGAPGATWRCKECHGWDYRGRDGAYSSGGHFTGIKGIGAMAGADPAAIAAILKDENHGYAEKMADQDLGDLANFVSRGQVDMDAFIDRKTGKAKGDALRRKDYYNTICANCHGVMGLRNSAMRPLGDAVNANPWEALHTLLNGHPNEKMPALRGLGIPVLVDILAHAQSLPGVEVLSSIVRGGLLYDNWYLEKWKPKPKKWHPAFKKDRKRGRDPAVSWRCKACHGWDYAGIRAMAGADTGDIVAVLKDATHAYLGVLNDRDFVDLANFVSRGQVDMDAFIDRETGKAKGDAAEFKPYYETVCAACHGLDGRAIITMEPLGKVTRRNPWEALHKILNGHPDEKMPALRVLDMSVLVGILAHAQGLADRR